MAHLVFKDYILQCIPLFSSVLLSEVLSSLLRLLPFLVHCSLQFKDYILQSVHLYSSVLPSEVLISLMRQLPFVVHCSTDSRTIYYNVSFCIVLSIPETTYLCNIIINGAKRQENFQLYFLRGKKPLWWWGQALFYNLEHLIFTLAQKSQGGARGLLPPPCVRYCGPSSADVEV